MSSQLNGLLRRSLLIEAPYRDSNGYNFENLTIVAGVMSTIVITDLFPNDLSPQPRWAILKNAGSNELYYLAQYKDTAAPTGVAFAEAGSVRKGWPLMAKEVEQVDLGLRGGGLVKIYVSSPAGTQLSIRVGQ